MLLQVNQHEKYAWLCGAIPMFDNVAFEEDVEQGSRIPNYLDREVNLANLKSTKENVVTGNRLNLMFVSTALEHIRQNEQNHQKSKSDVARLV
jgi:hypothetical protein